MKHSRNIFLIGPMGAGKTTVGRQLARALDMDFYDSDHEIETRTGVDIPVIFEYEGEEGFRKRESSMLKELTGLEKIVLATGGGAILRSENRNFLQQNGYVVYLKCAVNRQLERTARDTHRPLLHCEDPRGRLEAMARIRNPLYQKCADSTIDTGALSSRTAVKQILKNFKQDTY